MDQSLINGTIEFGDQSQRCIHNDRIKKDRGTLIISLSISVLLVLLEIIGGKLSGSLSIFSDAVHLLSDSAGYIIGLVGLTISMKEPFGRFTFGYSRAETISAFISILIIWWMNGLLSYYGILRLYTPKPIESQIMLFVAIIALGGNLSLVMFISKRHHQRQLLNEDPSQNTPLQSNQTSPNLRAAIIHLIVDCFQSGIVLLASLILRFNPKWVWVDPLCSILSSAIIFLSSIPLMRDTLLDLMECSPYEHQRLEGLKNGIRDCSREIFEVSKLHLWSLGHNRHCLVISIKTEDVTITKETTRIRCIDFIKREFPLINDITIQVE
jgi:cation diffusion facilitator family transporter